MFGGILAFQNATVNINELDFYTGRIAEKGITSHSSLVAGHGSVSSKVFYFKLDGLNEVLATYNRAQLYDDLDKKLKVGDTIKVYFKNANHVAGLNLNVYQLEKNGVVVLSEDKYRFREKLVGIIAIAGGFLLLYLTFRYDNKYKGRKRSVFRV